MKVHFIGALHGDKDVYRKILDYVEEKGYEVISKHSIERKPEDLKEETEEEAELYVKKMRRWLRKADLIIVEATRSNLGAGFETSSALEMGKPVIVMYKPEPGNTPHVLKGQNTGKLQIVKYDDDMLEEVLELALEYAEEQMDTRFNFFISPQIGAYLDWIAKKKRTPRAVYLRNLIKNDMKNDDEYNG